MASASDTHAAFPSTLWSRIQAGVEAESLAAREALFRSYWPPVYGYVRRQLSVDHQQACDLTQGFFVDALQAGLLRRADPERGRFRAFLKTCLQNYLVDAHRRDRAEKRGGQARHLHLDSEDGADVASLLADRKASPDKVLDELWRRQLVRNALARVEEELRQEGRQQCWEVFESYFLADEDLDYRTLAARHDISTHDVSNHLRRAKQRYRARLEAVVMETVQDEEHLQEELDWLFGRQT